MEVAGAGEEGTSTAKSSGVADAQAGAGGAHFLESFVLPASRAGWNRVGLLGQLLMPQEPRSSLEIVSPTTLGPFPVEKEELTLRPQQGKEAASVKRDHSRPRGTCHPCDNTRLP